MFVLQHLWLIPLLPLLGAAVNGLWGGRWPKSTIAAVALGSTALSFLCVVELVREFFRLDPAQIPWTQEYFTWIRAGGFRANYALEVDRLTLIMLLVVTGVGWLIHLYSTGYMAEDGGYRRFFAYLNLFVFFMTTLILGANYLVLFVGWEGVGLCSYLLVGFWFLKKSATNAGNKAFWVTRTGDVGFLIGLFLIFRQFGTLDFDTIFRNAGTMPVESAGHGVLTAICLLLLAGATGKSAQIPLYVWLPDAMEGPTPVSALIHAATMVTAGVYMIARSHVLFLLAPMALHVVAVIGCLTAFFAATIALVLSDFKKVLAYSTISQLGYMFLGCGVGAFGAGVFHLMTHAFFKALLFLGAGSVIHALGGEQDMRRMGGLRKRLPITYATMLMAALAIAGAPGFSGFFSKDEILEAVRTGPFASPLLYALGVVTAGLTSFYIFRLIFLTFHGEARWDETHVHVHESPRNMSIPLIVLAVLSVIGGWWAAPTLIGGSNYFARFLIPVFGGAEPILVNVVRPPVAVFLSAIFGPPVIAGLIGFLVAYWFYIQRPGLPERLAESMRWFYRLLCGKYFIDELYAAVIVRPLLWISTQVFWHALDERQIDAAVNDVGRDTREIGDRLRHWNSGNTRSYATWIVLGALALTTILLWVAR